MAAQIDKAEYGQPCDNPRQGQLVPHIAQFALFVGAAFLLAITPGPGIFYVVAGSLGVSSLILASLKLFTTLKPIGALYLVWMGIRTFLSARRDAAITLAGGKSPPPIRPRRVFRKGILVEAINPKTAAFFWRAFRNSLLQRKVTWRFNF